jgi:hypothetical protein
MAITKMRFLQRRRGRPRWLEMKGAGLRSQDIAGHFPFPRHAPRHLFLKRVADVDR